MLGDWSPVVRDGIDLLPLLLLGGAVVHALAGRTGWAVLLAFLGGITVLTRLVNLPRVYDRSGTSRSRASTSSPDPRDETHLRHSVGIAVVATALGIHDRRAVGDLRAAVGSVARHGAVREQRRHERRPRA